MDYITEMSIFYKLSRPPSTPVNELIPFMVDPRHQEIQRVIPKSATIEDIPEWLLFPKTTNMKFIYDVVQFYNATQIQFTGVYKQPLSKCQEEQLSKDASSAPCLVTGPFSLPVIAERNSFSGNNKNSVNKKAVNSYSKDSPKSLHSSALCSTLQGVGKKGNANNAEHSKQLFVECTFHSTRGVLACTGIKKRYIDIFNKSIQYLFDILDTTLAAPNKISAAEIFNQIPIVENGLALYKAFATGSISKPWDRTIFADVITNDWRVSQYMGINESSSTLGNRSILSLTIMVPLQQGGNCCIKAVITCNQSRYSPSCNLSYSDKTNQVDIKLSRLPHTDVAHTAFVALRDVLHIYDTEYDKLADIYSAIYVRSAAHLSELPSQQVVQRAQANGIEGSIDTKKSTLPNGTVDTEVVNTEDKTFAHGANNVQIVRGIEKLRKEVPELFVRNYTRECPVLPMIVPRDIAMRTQFIFYPNNDFGRYYVAPDNYFVGLKRNRLYNKDKFPYLVCCYMSDHTKKKNSDTYKYINEIAESKSKRDYTLYRPIPRSLHTMDAKYLRVGVGKSYDSFIKALEKAIGTSVDIDTIPWIPQLVKQELWDKEDDYIMSTIKGSNRTYISGSLFYRYFEDLLKISIHVIVIKNGKFEPLLPRHVHPYIWYHSYPHKNIVVFENIKVTYGITQRFHEILIRRDNKLAIFDIDDDYVMSIVTAKMRETSSPPIETLLNNRDTVASQIIDEDGKCRLIITMSGKKINTCTRPLSVSVTEWPICFFDAHIKKMNDVKINIGLNPVDPAKRSTKHLRYFPNNQSFQAWHKLQSA